jgi:hypothetical protein
VRVGMEATGYSRWFERLLAELGFELWIGHPAQIKAKRVKKQKYDREDARLLLRPMRENNFPQVWVPNPENRDVRQLLWHRHRMVQMRTRIMNQLQALAMNEGYRWKKKLFSFKGSSRLGNCSKNTYHKLMNPNAWLGNAGLASRRVAFIPARVGAKATRSRLRSMRAPSGVRFSWQCSPCCGTSLGRTRNRHRQPGPGQ